MSLLKIAKYPADTLRQKAEPIDKQELASSDFQQFAKNMMETLENEYPLGAGLAANQVGELKRIFVINLEINDGKFLKQTFINPTVLEVAKEIEIDWEGCLSFPDQWGKVKRPISTKIKAQNLKGEDFTVTANKFYARLLLHEIDHLDGVLFTDKLESEIIDTRKLDNILKQQDKDPVEIG